MREFGLRTRLLAGTIMVAAAAVAATAWLSVQGTTTSIEQQKGSLHEAYSEAYEGLVDYAATHTDWSSVEPVLDELQQQTGARIVVTPAGGKPSESSSARASSATSTNADHATRSVSIDPLAVDDSLTRSRFPDGIDPQVVGPFELTAQEHSTLRNRAEDVASCLQRHGATSTIAETHNGRPYLRIPRSHAPPACRTMAGQGNLVGFVDSPRVEPTRTEKKALVSLLERLVPCHGHKAIPTPTLNGMGEITTVDTRNSRTHTCLVDARRQMLRPYVAPTASLEVTPLDHDAHDGVGLSSAGALQVAGAAAIVLLLTIGVAMLLARRVVRPVYALTAAARRMRVGERQVRADTNARWEIAELTRAFNEMAEHVEATDRQRKELMSDISHELRTPLGTVRGWLIAAQDGVVDLDPELVASLLEETGLLHHLVDDLRDLALVDSGELRLEPVELNLGDLLRHVASASSDRATVEAPADLLVVADPVRLRQAVGNLVANAERHTPDDEPITVSAYAGEPGIVVEVTDTGPGIAEEELPHVFERFWRADKSRNRRTGGSGLGLAIVRQLVEAHGGEVTVTSTPGAGSTFTVRLPDMNESS